jgi:hypothetical protein
MLKSNPIDEKKDIKLTRKMNINFYL